MVYLIHCVQQGVGALLAQRVIDVAVAGDDIEELGAHRQLLTDEHVLLPGLAHQGEPVTVGRSSHVWSTSC